MKKILLLVILTLSMSLTAANKENSFDKTVNKTEQGISTVYVDMLTDFINPEFGAMKMLFEVVQTIK